MHIITVDLGEYAFNGVDDIAFDSNDSVLGHDLVVMDLARAVSHFRGTLDGEYNGSLRLYDGAPFTRAIERRRAEVTALLESGATVVAFTPPNTTVYVESPDQSDVAAGRVRIEAISPLDILPLKLASESAAGRVVAPSVEAFRAFFEANNKHLRYDGILTEIPRGCTVLAKVEKTQSPVAIHGPVSRGHVLILPRPGRRPTYDPDGAYMLNEPSREYFAALPTLIDALTKTKVLEAPHWARRYLIPGEREALDLTEQSRAAVSVAEETLKKNAAALSRLQRVKQLLYADGAALEDVVREAFKELGFSIEPQLDKNREPI